MKKRISYFVFLLTNFMVMNVVYADDDYCTGLSSTLKFIGHIVFIAKIFIPIVIILFGIIDMFKAVTSAKDDEIKKSAVSLGRRIIAGVCIFFLPAFIDLIFSWVDSWNNNSNYQSKYNECFKCVWDVNNCGTSSSTSSSTTEK